MDDKTVEQILDLIADRIVALPKGREGSLAHASLKGLYEELYSELVKARYKEDACD